MEKASHANDIVYWNKYHLYYFSDISVAVGSGKKRNVGKVVLRPMSLYFVYWTVKHLFFSFLSLMQSYKFLSYCLFLLPFLLCYTGYRCSHFIVTNPLIKQPHTEFSCISSWSRSTNVSLKKKVSVFLSVKVSAFFQGRYLCSVIILKKLRRKPTLKRVNPQTPYC